MNDKNIEKSCVMEAPAAPARAHNAGDGAVGAGPGGRFSAQRKLAAVQRLLRGEALEMVSRELNVPAHRLSQWRDRVLEAGMSALKQQERDARDDEIVLRRGYETSRSACYAAIFNPVATLVASPRCSARI